MSFNSYLATRRATRHPNGYFVLEARADREFPNAEIWAAIRGYLATLRACNAAMKEVCVLWRRYSLQGRLGTLAGQTWSWRLHPVDVYPGQDLSLPLVYGSSATAA
jgi:hypothetical protein